MAFGCGGGAPVGSGEHPSAARSGLRRAASGMSPRRSGRRRLAVAVPVAAGLGSSWSLANGLRARRHGSRLPGGGVDGLRLLAAALRSVSGEHPSAARYGFDAPLPGSLLAGWGAAAWLMPVPVAAGLGGRGWVAGNGGGTGYGRAELAATSDCGPCRWLSAIERRRSVGLGRAPSAARSSGFDAPLPGPFLAALGAAAWSLPPPVWPAALRRLGSGSGRRPTKVGPP